MNTRTRLVLGLFGVFVFVLLSFATPLMENIRGIAWQSWVAIVGRILGVGSTELNPTVQTQLEKTLAENARLRAELEDYQQLRDDMAAPAFSGFRAIPAAVAATTLDSFGTQKVINRGTRDGVQMGAPVVIRESILVGFITSLTDTTSVFTLLTHPKSSIAAGALAEERTGEGLVEGRFYTSLTLTTLPRDVDLAEDDEVVTRNSAREIPGGLLIGRVARIERDDQAAYQEAQLHLPFDPRSLRGVSVLVVR